MIIVKILSVHNKKKSQRFEIALVLRKFSKSFSFVADLARKTVVFFVNASDAGGISMKATVDSRPNH